MSSDDASGMKSKTACAPENRCPRIGDRAVDQRQSYRNIIRSWGRRSNSFNTKTPRAVFQLGWREKKSRFVGWWTFVAQARRPSPQSPQISSDWDSASCASSTSIETPRLRHRRSNVIPVEHRESVSPPESKVEEIRSPSPEPQSTTVDELQQQLTTSIYTLPLPEAITWQEWQELVDILKEVDSVSPDMTARFIPIWSYNVSEARIKYEAQPCIRSILRLDLSAMLEIVQHCRRWH